MKCAPPMPSRRCVCRQGGWRRRKGGVIAGGSAAAWVTSESWGARETGGRTSGGETEAPGRAEASRLDAVGRLLVNVQPPAGQDGADSAHAA